MIRAVFFDIDGTLMDFHAAERSAFLTAMRLRGIDRAEERYPRYTAFNRALWQELERGTLSREVLLQTRFPRFFAAEGITQSTDGFEALYRAHLSDGHTLLAGAREILEYCAAKYPLYVVTNGIAATQHKRLRDAALTQYFQKVYISEEIGYAKPDKRFFDSCMRDAGLRCPEQILIVGDSLTSDMRGGIDAGLKTCWLRPEASASRTLPVDYEITHLCELKGIL